MKKIKAVYFKNGKTSNRAYTFRYDPDQLIISIDDVCVVTSPFEMYSFVIITEVTDEDATGEETQILCVVPQVEE